ncbi:hypothetical protein GGP80_001304 [Salinibacter ruber]|uniref:Uncharacterized protein n=1 Tax=Salinibacter ruber TaxID=146919 RepID=A0A9X2ZTF3_9BACT|nr:hypothetical protein [Salinibacter ruber]MBB4069118.1 hypothetical protein [Salinibacter ruber]MCS3638211.1 hypothetical protein [Salinibacter ruber]MCS3660818.1 hypothetical protein [Salinibacter ruber]MCS3669410.1 hypothetical protein [Salinibacter ruber]
MNVHSGNLYGGTSFPRPPDFTGFPIASHNPFGKFPPGGPLRLNPPSSAVGPQEEMPPVQHITASAGGLALILQARQHPLRCPLQIGKRKEQSGQRRRNAGSTGAKAATWARASFRANRNACHRTGRPGPSAPRVPGRDPCPRTRRRWRQGGIRSSSWLTASAGCCTITTIPPTPEPLLLIANAGSDWTVMAAETALRDQERGVTLLLGPGRKGRSWDDVRQNGHRPGIDTRIWGRTPPAPRT